MKITRQQLRRLIESLIVDPKGEAVSSADAMKGVVKKSKAAISSMGYPDAADKLFNKQGVEGIEQGIALASDSVQLDDFEGAAANIGYDRANKPDAGLAFPSPFNPDTTIIKVVYPGIENLLDHPDLGTSTEYGPYLNIKLSDILKTQGWVTNSKHSIDELWSIYTRLKKANLNPDKYSSQSKFSKKHSDFTDDEFKDILTSIVALKHGIEDYIIANDPVNNQNMQFQINNLFDTMIDYFPRTLFTRFWMELEEIVGLYIFGY